MILLYEFVIALAENAAANGVELKLKTEVLAIEKNANGFTITTSKETIQSKYVINAAGVYSDKVSSMIGIDDFKITPRRGQYILLDKDQNYLVNSYSSSTYGTGKRDFSNGYVSW